MRHSHATRCPPPRLLPGQHARKCAPARSRHSAAGGVAGERLERDDDLWKDRTTARRTRTRGRGPPGSIDRTAATGTATVAMTATAADRMAVDSIITAKAMTVWRRWRPRMTQSVIRGTGAQSPVRRARADAWQARWAGIALAGGTGRGLPENFRGSVVLVMLVAQGARCRGARSSHGCCRGRCACVRARRWQSSARGAG
jgi:hypothetical protein